MSRLVKIDHGVQHQFLNYPEFDHPCRLKLSNTLWRPEIDNSCLEI